MATLQTLRDLTFVALGDSGYPEEPTMATVSAANAALNRSVRDLTYDLELAGMMPLISTAAIAVTSDVNDYDLDDYCISGGQPDWRRLLSIERTDGANPVPIEFPHNADFRARNVGRFIGYPIRLSTAWTGYRHRMYREGSVIRFIDDTHEAMTLTVKYAPFVPEMTQDVSTLDGLGLNYLSAWPNLIAELAALRLFTNVNASQYALVERNVNRDMARFLSRVVEDYRLGGHRRKKSRWR